MKDIFIKNINSIDNISIICSLSGWIKAKREKKQVVFFDMCDSTGCIQLVFEKEVLGNALFDLAKNITIESAVEVSGIIQINELKNKEIKVRTFSIISESIKHYTPELRSNFDIFDERYANQILSNRHVYLRNPKLMAIQRFRNLLLHYMRNWFFENNFTEIAAPVLSPIPLYNEKTAIPATVNGQKLFLSQCAGYYLEASAMAFEKVYNISPSFRGEESKSKRHLLEYWHIKAEFTFGNLEDIIAVVESIFKYLTEELQQATETAEIFQTLGTKFCLDGLNIPFPRISYENAIEFLQQKGCNITFGESIGAKEEEDILSQKFQSPFWITGIPKNIEPFPYSINEKDTRVTKTADLIGSNLYGELLGVAEKIHTIDMLDERFKEKGIYGNEKYEWIRDIHQAGCVPHVAFGMGVERLIRWMMNIPHVRDVHPFPRIFDRKIVV
jgi:asparaginyl-tRNA synthetase